jgi:hypothetical protein
MRIKQVPEFPCSCGADFHAGGITPVPHPLDTKSTFFHNIFHSGPVPQIMNVRIQFFHGNIRLGPVKDSPLVRTGRNTITATYAPIVIDHHNAVRFLPRCPDRAYTNAGRIFALLALNGQVHETRFRYCFGMIVMFSILEVDQASLL